MRLWEIINENHGKYYCSTDKKWKYRKGPKQTRKVNERGIPDYTTMPTYKLKKASKGKQKFFLPSNEPTPKGVQAVEDAVDFPGTYVKKEYVTINGVKMLRDVWDYMTHDREEEHGFDDKANRVHKGLSNFTGKEDPEVLKKAYQVELRNFIDEFENQDMDPQPFIDELEQLDENFADGKKKGKSRPGRVKRSGASCKGSVTSLRAKAKKYSGERGKMYHWCANMKSGKKKSK